MIRTISRCLALIGPCLSVTACAGYQPLDANCFTFQDAAALAASTANTTTATVSTMGAEVTRGDTECDFVMLGAGG